jgi:hypothetical protein
MDIFHFVDEAAKNSILLALQELFGSDFKYVPLLSFLSTTLLSC